MRLVSIRIMGMCSVLSCFCHFIFYINPLSARIFTVFGHSLLEDRVLHKEAWFAKLLGTHLSIQVHKKVKFPWRDNSPLALKGSNDCPLFSGGQTPRQTAQSGTQIFRFSQLNY